MCVPLWSNHNQYFDPMNIVVHASPEVVLTLQVLNYPRKGRHMASQGAPQTTVQVMNDSAIFGGVQWSSSPVTFHRNKGENVKLTESNTVATRTKGFGDALVFTSEPMIVGEMLKVTVTQRAMEEEGYYFGMVRAHLV